MWAGYYTTGDLRECVNGVRHPWTLEMFSIITQGAWTERDLEGTLGLVTHAQPTPHFLLFYFHWYSLNFLMQNMSHTFMNKWPGAVLKFYNGLFFNILQKMLNVFIASSWEVIKDAKFHWNICFLFEQMILYMSQLSHPVVRMQHRHQGYPVDFWQAYCSFWQCFWRYSTYSSNMSQTTSGSWNNKDPLYCSSQERDLILVLQMFICFLLPIPTTSLSATWTMNNTWRGIVNPLPTPRLPYGFPWSLLK